MPLTEQLLRNLLLLNYNQQPENITYVRERHSDKLFESFTEMLSQEDDPLHHLTGDYMTLYLTLIHMLKSQPKILKVSYMVNNLRIWFYLQDVNKLNSYNRIK